MEKIADLSLLNPIYEYLPYCVRIREEIDPATKQKVRISEYAKTYPPFPWKRDGENGHTGEDPIEFIDECARMGLVHWETKEQEQERRVQERAYGGDAPVSYEEYQRLTEQNRGNNTTQWDED